MKTIFFDSRKMVLCTQAEYAALEVEVGAVVLFNADPESVAMSVKLLATQEVVPAAYMIGEDVDAMYAMVCVLFEEVDAAGGVVENASSQVLMIHRNGMWDLPKGHREAGEDVEVTAVREVEEECGVRTDELGDLICVTDHTYHLGDRHILKHTYWYRMKVAGQPELKPQSEEGITEVKWISKSDLKEYVDKTYPSIKLVMSRL